MQVSVLAFNASGQQLATGGLDGERGIVSCCKSGSDVIIIFGI